ncbi:hypothetical protein AAH559_005403 [Salmonella enterica]
MNMKKITGVLGGATALLLACGDAGASALIGSTEVPIKVTVAGALVPAKCSFTGKQLIQDITTGEPMGTLSCANPNSASINIAVIQGSGSVEASGDIRLRNGNDFIIGILFTEHGDMVPVAPAGSDSAALPNGNIVNGGANIVFNLLSALDTDPTPSGDYTGTIVIGTWAA